MKVAVLGSDPRMFGAVAARLEESGVATLALADVAALLAADPTMLAEVEVLYAPGFMRIDGDVLARLPRLRGLVSPFTGVENFDRAAAAARGVLIGNGQIDENVASMAEATVLMLLAAAYRLTAAAAAMSDGAWPRPTARGRMLQAMTIGLVGYGRIAQGVAARLTPFGCAFLVHAPRLRAQLPPRAEAVSLERLVAESDAIVVLAALGHDNRGMIDADMIARMKPDAIVVNTARGPLIDEAALVAAASAGRLGCVALDVFEQEPLPPDAPVRTVPDAILTPHTIGHTRETIARLPLHAYDNIRRILAGEPAVSLVNPEALPAWRTNLEETPA